MSTPTIPVVGTCRTCGTLIYPGDTHYARLTVWQKIGPDGKPAGTPKDPVAQGVYACAGCGTIGGMQPDTLF